MRLSDTLQRFSRVVPHFLRVAELGAIRLERQPEGGLEFVPRLSEELTVAELELVKTAGESMANKIEIYLYGKVLLEGPKVFRPRLDQLQVLEHMRLNVEIGDYAQPFPTVVVEFPEDYLQRKCVHCPQEGEWHYGSQIAAEHVPGYAIVRHEPELGCLMTCVMFSSDLSIKTALVPRAGETIESYLASFTDRDKFSNTMEITDEEWAVTRECLRSALNYCLLLDEVGCRHAGPQNPKHWQRLQRHAEAGRRRGDPSDRARAALAAHPQLYELCQEVTLYRTVDRHDELPEATGRTVSPHHRRGHYRMQAHGPGRQERKRIRVPPTFVNCRFFLGKMSDTRATYTEAK